jgi:hypothetical protein
MKKEKQNYVAMLKDPRWQKKRLEIMQRDNFTCQHCGCTDKSLQVHHLWYSSLKKPWEYNDESLITLCEHCHELETEYNGELYSSFCDFTLTGILTELRRRSNNTSSLSRILLAGRGSSPIKSENKLMKNYSVFGWKK